MTSLNLAGSILLQELADARPLDPEREATTLPDVEAHLLPAQTLARPEGGGGAL